MRVQVDVLTQQQHYKAATEELYKCNVFMY
jgi:hypothetical protein